MGNLSMAFHFMSLIVLMALILWVLRLQTMLKVWRDWAVRGGDRRVVVGEPVRVLRQFACAIGADFVSDVSIDAITPARLSLDSCFDLHRQARIDRILVENKGAPSVCFVLSREPGTMEFDIQSIVRELGGSLAVKISRSSESVGGQ